MGFSKSKKLISRDVSGHWVRNDISEGTHSRTELQNRSDAAKVALEEAISSDSSAEGVVGDILKHPATDEAVKRFQADTRSETARYDAIHGKSADKQQDDTGELSGKEKLSNASARSGSVTP